jgi:ankyrin repeat protein
VAPRGDNYAAGLLIEAGTEIDARGDMSCTPLYLAVMNGHEQVAATFLEHGADPDAGSELGSTLRELALRSNKSTLIDLFTKVGPNKRWRGP